MKVATCEAMVLDAKVLFGPLHKLKLSYGNSAATKCDLFTAAGFLVVKTNTGDFKAPAEGELWPPVQIPMKQVKQMAKVYAKSGGPVRFQRVGAVLKVDSTVLTIV